MGDNATAAGYLPCFLGLKLKSGSGFIKLFILDSTKREIYHARLLAF